MGKSITMKLFMVFMAFVICFVIGIGSFIKFVLPDYYKDKILQNVENSMSIIGDLMKNDPDEAYVYMEKLLDENGGTIAEYDKLGMAIGQGMGNQMGQGRGRNAGTVELPLNSDEKFATAFKNKYGIEFYIYGIPTEFGWLIYELPLQSIDSSIGIFLDFLWIILISGVGFSVLVSLFLSRTITKPIKEMSIMAGNMSRHDAVNMEYDDRKDEIGDLKNSLINMYTELISNIQKLKNELEKEKSLDIMRKKFMGQVSHELNTPISVVSGYSELIYDGIYKDEDELKLYVDNIVKEVSHMKEIIRDILDASKSASGELKYNMERFDFKSLTDDVLRRFGPVISSKGFDFSTVLLDKEIFLTGDPLRIEQLINNLISNAVEHCDQALTVKVESIDKMVKLSVFNTGINISEDEVPLIFEPFYKREGKKSGTGLGLAMVREIVESHRGRYLVINHHNGVEFIVMIPIM